MILLLLSCSNDIEENLNFKRLSFEVGKNKNSETLKFNRKSFSWLGKGVKKGNAFGKNITKGVGVVIKRNRSFRVFPGEVGKKGISFTFFAFSKKKDLKISIIIRRKNKILHNEIFKKNIFKRYSRTVIEEMEFKKNDEIILKASGKGILILSDLVIYDIIPKSERKYLFIIALDNMSIGKIDRKKNNVFLTPALNKLKGDSVYFGNAFAQSSWTYPSFMSMFSGLYEHNLNLKKNIYLAAEKPFLVEQIAKKFITVSFNGGVWLQPKYGGSRGFDIIQYVAGTEDRYSGDILFKRAIDYLKKSSTPKLMMFLHSYQVHSPFAPEEEFLKKINPFPKFTKLWNYTNKNFYKNDVDPVKREALVDLYDAEIMEFDSYLDKFIKYLESENIYEQSMIVFLSDHGEEFYEHSGWYHGHSLYNELIKVPLMIKFPGKKIPPQINFQNVGLLDLFPTILNYYKIKIPSNIDGISLMQTIKEGVPSRDIYFSTSCQMLKNIPVKVGLIDNQYKIIYNFPYTKKSLDYFSEINLPPAYKPFEIYDLNKDPLELNNLIEKKKNLLKINRKKINKIIKTIIKNSSQKEYNKIKLSEKEKEKLKSLGYL